MPGWRRVEPRQQGPVAAEVPGRDPGSGLDSRREMLFAGRGPELETFEALLAGTGGRRVIAVTGIGKSTLVRARERRARGTGIDWTRVDGGVVQPGIRRGCPAHLDKPARLSAGGCCKRPVRARSPSNRTEKNRHCC